MSILPNGEGGQVEPPLPPSPPLPLAAAPTERSAISGWRPPLNSGPGTRPTENSPTAPAAPGLTKGEEEAAATADVTNKEFLTAVFADCAPGASAAVCSKPGDPNEGGWAAQPALENNATYPPGNNNFFNCSSMNVAVGSLQAKKEHFAAYHALVLDDVGTKVNEARLSGFAPSWRLETSPGNYQVGFLLSPPIRDLGELAELQSRTAAAGLGDPGAFGAVRWARLPRGINGKPKYKDDSGKPFVCRLSMWQPDRKYSASDLAAHLALPPPPANSTVARRQQSAGPRNDDVCSHPPDENPVVAALKDRKLYKSQLEPGKHDITCPWSDEHTEKLDTGACYWEPNDSFPTGGFRCLHSHGDRLHIGELLRHLGIEASAAANKPEIRSVQGAFDQVIRAAEGVLASTGRVFQSGGAIAAVATDPATGDVRIETFTEQRLKRELARAANWKQPTQSGWKVVDPPAGYVTGLFKAQRYDVLPELRGLARQPYLGPDGALVLTSGFNPTGGIYGSFDPARFTPLDTTREGAVAALAELRDLVSEFQFAGESDEAAAICAMMTAVLRPSLPLAPAFNITASSPGSGKSYLADLIAAFATPGQPAKVSYPATSEEATKSVLSNLLPGPAAIIFDDMTRDWLAYGSINRMLTSETITDRILGMSRVQQVSTRTLVLGTGNNIEPLSDLRRRVLSLRIQPKVANPALISYKGRPVERVRADRDRYVAQVLSLFEAWRKAGSPRAAPFPVASFGIWSDFCREPLLWLGMPDPATSLQAQLRDDPDADNLKEFVSAWHQLRGEQPTMVRHLAAKAGETATNGLQAALDELPVWDGGKLSPTKLGWYIKKHCGRVVDNMMIQPAESSARRAWRVVVVTPPLPPLKGEKGEPAERLPGDGDPTAA